VQNKKTTALTGATHQNIGFPFGKPDFTESLSEA